MGFSREQHVAREEFLNRLCVEIGLESFSERHSPGEETPCPTWSEIKRAGLLILRHAKSYQRIQTMACNGPQHLQTPYYWERPKLARIKEDEWDTWMEKREKQLESRLHALAAEIGVTLSLGGDPRGFTVKLMTPKSGKYNSWGGAEDGWGVPVFFSPSEWS